jgi:hypothetical protein
MNPIFFIQNIRSEQIKKKCLELNFIRQALLIPREPVTNYHRVTARWQFVFDDYHKLIEEINQHKQLQAAMIEVIIGLMYHVDYGTNPNTNDEIFKQITEMCESGLC